MITDLELSQVCNIRPSLCVLVLPRGGGAGAHGAQVLDTCLAMCSLLFTRKHLIDYDKVADFIFFC